MLDDAIYEGKSCKVLEVFMAANMNGFKMFQGVKQGYRINHNRFCAHYECNIKTNAQDWIRKKYEKSFRAQDEADYSSSVPLKAKEAYEHSADLQNYITN